MMKKLFLEDKDKLMLKMLTFKIESSTLIDGHLLPEVFKRERYIQI
jgi:hypothetical protein